MEKPLLGSSAERSDDSGTQPSLSASGPSSSSGGPSQQPVPPSPAASTRQSPPRGSQQFTAVDVPDPIMVIVESLIPVRGHAIEINPSETISVLKARYAQKLWDEASKRDARPSRPGALQPAGPAVITPGMTEQEYELHIRLVCDGAELGDNTRIEELGLTQGTRIVALDRRQRRGFVPKVMRFLHHWWPLLIIVLLMIVLIIEASGTAQQLCNRPLLTFVLLAAPLLTPYGLVLSGRFQPETGRRMLWFINHRHLARLVAVNAVVALIWFIVGAVRTAMPPCLPVPRSRAHSAHSTAGVDLCRRVHVSAGRAGDLRLRAHSVEPAACGQLAVGTAPHHAVLAGVQVRVCLRHRSRFGRHPSPPGSRHQPHALMCLRSTRRPADN